MNKIEGPLAASITLVLLAAACGSEATPTQGAAVVPQSESTPTLSMPTPDLSTSTPTATPIPTSTPGVSAEQQALETSLNNKPLSDYPALINAAGNEQTGENISSIPQIKDYFTLREAATGIQGLDRMFAQLSLPVNPNVFKDRQLNHDRAGYGMGFDQVNLDWLKPLAELQQKQLSGEWIGGFGPNDQHYRAWTLVTPRDIDKAVLLMVDEFIRLGGPGDRQALFDQITKGDFGIKEQPDDGQPLLINDHFTACETFSAPAATRSQQPEQARGMEFKPDAETPNNGVEEEQVNLHDSDNSMLVAMVTDGKTLWVEARDLANPPDPLNGSLEDKYYDGQNNARVHGGRLMPCGPGLAPEILGGATPVPPQPGTPTPIPTNEHIIPTQKPKPEPPDPGPQPTEIP